jgi:hypothetical protein
MKRVAGGSLRLFFVNLLLNSAPGVSESRLEKQEKKTVAGCNNFATI